MNLTYNDILKSSIDDMAASLQKYEILGKEAILRTCIQKRLDATLMQYYADLQQSVDYLSNMPASKVFKEINYQQKLQYKEQQDLFTPTKGHKVTDSKSDPLEETHD